MLTKHQSEVAFSVAMQVVLELSQTRTPEPHVVEAAKTVIKAAIAAADAIGQTSRSIIDSVVSEMAA